MRVFEAMAVLVLAVALAVAVAYPVRAMMTAAMARTTVVLNNGGN